MKSLFFAVVAVFTFSPTVHAESMLVTGRDADALVDSLKKLGLDPVGTGEYFQSGITACESIYDDQGKYFSGAPGDYIGEYCMIYGDSYESDSDGVLHAAVLIPADDREMKQHPELKEKLEKLKAVRLALENLVIPLERVATVEGREIVIRRASGVSGIACEGHSQGVRQCWVKLSSLCPPRRR